MPLAAGTARGPYEILNRLDRIVAIKVSNEAFSERFEREARAVAALNHTYLCRLYDVGPDYLVMKFGEGLPPRK